MKVILLAALLALCACAAEPAGSVQPTSFPAACRLPFPGLAKLKAHGVMVIEVAEPAELVRIYNDEPPVSDVRPDHVYLVRRQDDPGVVVLVRAGCIVGHFPVTEEVLTALERGGA